MSRGVAFTVAAGGLIAWAVAVGGEGPVPRNALEARGQYIVERVAMCQDCHSPRSAEGFFVVDEWMGGAPIGFTPTVPMPWAELAPPIAGLPTMTDEEAVIFMASGKKPDGTQARPPMPEYRMNLEDAQAVVAHLKSLAPD